MGALKAAPEQEQEVAQGITGITVAGYKSIREEQHIEVRPLTILAGANSSGKSSIMQPLLLLKQTLEAPFDPGPLWLGGPNVEFNSAEQMLSRGTDNLSIGIKVSSGNSISVLVAYTKATGLRVQEVSYISRKHQVTIRPDIKEAEILERVPRIREYLGEYLSQHRRNSHRNDNWLLSLAIGRDRWLLQPELTIEGIEAGPSKLQIPIFDREFGTYGNPSSLIQKMIHVRGLRGNPERTYPVTAVGNSFPGRFESYVASIIAQWQTTSDKGKLVNLVEDLKHLDLTSSISANRLNDTQVELQVSRLPIKAKQSKRADMVNIADVGFGVSQALPVLVALHVAQPGQLVYVEQPELHLHPRAQWEMARVLADAANRGVRVVAETHSSLLLLGIQTMVAQDIIASEKVKLHWFTRNSEGNTEIKSADLTETGGFGDWPENFADVSLGAQIEYLNASEMRAQAH